MDIKFVYPDITAAEFTEAVGDLNRDIDNGNRLSSIPRLFAFVFQAVMLVATCAAIYVSWMLVIFLITGRDKTTIIAGLLCGAIMAPSAFSLQRKSAPLLKRLLLKAFSLRDYEEKFTVKEYADREDARKRLADDLKFYNLCDELRSHKVTDATITYDGNECEVDISYGDPRTGSDVVRRVRLPLRIVSGSGCVVVDFERKCVVFPEQGG